ncbi:P-loop containing nucleoside triphosphate hydrolase protein [Hesseltinella vesiculosa]|uniref:P-loop containing nucleoside triphosphate hydrolase protein n=1 Tax=Hesseltinella vesiculosa TaxID=101127 RepID=A0A1X2GD16_9FUNG|nr:P-loop containing nucleoside triphosphate hydrolase protein [Hesseltinella vesiculosa]
MEAKASVTKPTPLLRLFRFASTKDRVMIAIATCFSLALGAIQPASMIFYGKLLGNMHSLNEAHVMQATQPLVLVLVYMGTGVLVGAYVSNCLWVMCGENQAKRMRVAYVHAVLHQDMAWFDEAADGSLTTRLTTDTQTVQDGISEKFGLMLTSLSQFTAGFVVAFVTSWRLSVIMLATIPMLAAFGTVMLLVTSRFTRHSQNAYAKAAAVTEQVFSAIRTVAAFQLQRRFAKRYEHALEKAWVAGIKRAVAAGLAYGGFMFILFATYSLTFWYGARLVHNQLIEGTSVLVVFTAMVVGAMSLVNVPPNLAAVASAKAAATHLFATIDRAPKIIHSPQVTAPPLPAKGELQFRHVSFAYPTRPDVPILQDLSFHIRPGMTVALVGMSGSGKSTTFQLLQRFYDPTNGQVLVDGKDARSWPLHTLRQQIGIVSQEPVLFNMTIRENLRLGTTATDLLPDTDMDKMEDAQLEHACRQAYCHDFIEKLPDGYNTLISSTMLSGGQKQRIAIARAILKNPPILLLDEATSALDTQSERLVQKALESASDNRTTLVIAHRLSTIRNADWIVVMDHGQIREQGTHDSLLDNAGIYADLVAQQTISTRRECDANQIDNDSIRLFPGPPSCCQSPTRNSLQTQTRYSSDRINTVSPTTPSPHRLHRHSSCYESFHPVSTTPTPISPIFGSDMYGDNDDTSTLPLSDNDEEFPPLETATAQGIAISDTPHPLPSQWNMTGRVLVLMKPEWPFLILGCFCATIAGAMFPLHAVVYGSVITEISNPGFGREVYGPLEGPNFYAFMFALMAAVALFGFSGQIISFESAGETFTQRLRQLLFVQYMKQEIGYFDLDDNKVGSLTTRLAVDAKNVNEMITKVWGDVVQFTVTACIGLTIAFLFSWRLALIILGVVPFLVMSSAYESLVHKRLEEKSRKSNEQSGHVACEAFTEIRTVAMLNRQAYFEYKYDASIATSHKQTVQKAYFASFGHGLNHAITMYAIAVAFHAGSHLISQRLMDVQSLMVTLLTLLSTAQGINRFSQFTAAFIKANRSAQCIFALLDRVSQIDPDLEGLELTTVDGKVDFQHIAFCYPARPDAPIFRGQFSLNIPTGKTVALVGKSGCGKSTSIGLLQRWYDPASGTVALDNHNTKSLALHNLRSHMALVGQEPVLFDMTIEENIRFGGHEDMELAVDDIVEACKQANIHNFISSLPNGYNTRVGDKGSQMSGGQKQRIAIARALISKPKLLLLDEATSALDSESEALVQRAIDNILSKGGRTAITIAHRLSSIQNADIICVVDNGQVIEQGDHYSLLELNGFYANLVQQQSLRVDV